MSRATELHRASMLAMREARLRAGLSQEEVAESTGIGLTTLRRYERAKGASIGVDHLLSIAELYGTTADAILRRGRAILEGDLQLGEAAGRRIANGRVIRQDAVSEITQTLPEPPVP